MIVSINSLPYEILSIILEEVARSNAREGVQYTYGLSKAPEPLQDVETQRVIRGQLPPDTLRWIASTSVRQVSRRWHDWATNYALESLQISRWMGSERWMQSRTLGDITGNPSGNAVYRDPYLSLRKTQQLFESYPSLVACVRRIFFNGYFGAETNRMVFNILRHCTHLDYLTLPWTALRYGGPDDWSTILKRGSGAKDISSLELLAIDLKESQMSKAANQVNKRPFSSSKVDFSGLRRLKIFGHSNFMPLTDEDLISISHTAVNLKEIHITGSTSSLTIDGIASLIDSSDQTLEVLEHSPLTADGFDHPNPAASLGHDEPHICRRLIRCSRLRNISVSLPALCGDLFDPSAKWCGEMQIRTSTICGRHPLSLKTSERAQNQFFHILDEARGLMASREREKNRLDVEIFVDGWIFEPRKSLVHGNLRQAKLIADGAWPNKCNPSIKGPYGQTGLYGKDEGPYECVSEDEFRTGLGIRCISF